MKLTKTDDEHLKQIYARTQKIGECLAWTGTLRRGRPSYVHRYCEVVPKETEDSAVKKEPYPLYIHPGRLLWTILKKEVLDDYCHLIPKCQTPFCINPDHMSKTHGRSTGLGRRKPWERLTDKQVEAIRFMYEHKRATQEELSVVFKVSRAAICLICSGKTFKNDEYNSDI